jgi:prolyl-tRNA editing enzyme YbaK/EbsC (Cys-tRNA(Pro) deacylase)
MRQSPLLGLFLLKVLSIQAFWQSLNHPPSRKATPLTVGTYSTTESVYDNSTYFKMPERLIGTDSPAFQNFLETVIGLQENQEQSVQLADKSSGLGEDDIHINSLVFEVKIDARTSPKEGHGAYILAILNENDRVNLTALEQAVLSSGKVEWDERQTTIALVPSSKVQEYCGFAPGTVPPIGLLPKPLVTIVEQQLTASMANSSKRLVGGGGAEGQQVRLTVSTLLEQSNVELAGFREDPNATTDAKWASKEQGASTFSISLPAGHDEERQGQKPFFAVEPPDRTAVEMILSDPGVPNPLQPTWVTVVGRISGIRQMARKLAFVDFAPISGPMPTSQDHPWRSGVTGDDMAVQLIAGKTICQRLGDEEGSQALKRLKVGQMVLIRGMTNVGSKTSLRHWIVKGSLDIVLFDYQILHEDTRNAFLEPLSPVVKKRPKAGPQSTPRNMPFLRLHEVYDKTEDGSAESVAMIVDSLDTVQVFAKSVSELIVSLKDVDEDDDVDDGSLAVGLVGMDCEWKPKFLLASRDEPQPVLVLQVCLHPLKRVFLFDLQILLRPFLGASEEMHEIEAAMADAMTELLLSKRLFKVGFQLVQDLRRMAASYPHISSFQLVHSVMEVSTLARKVIQLNKQGNGRQATSSLGRLTEHFVGRTLNKEEQISDWSTRPLTAEQIEYAALDSVVTPLIVEKVLDAAGAGFFEKPQVGRWKDDASFRESIKSWRFIFLDDTTDPQALKRLCAKKAIVGSSFIVDQQWNTGEEDPRLPSVSQDGKGSFIDGTGTFRVPSDTVCLDPANKDDIIDSIIGKRVAKTKDRVAEQFLVGSATLSGGSKLDFNARAGYIEFKNAVFLFVNMPRTAGYKVKNYNNKWVNDGQILTWFFRERDWKQGTSSLATKLTSADNSVVLFVRLGTNKFICCGRCGVEEEDPIGRDPSGDVEWWKLIKLHLVLKDWDKLQPSRDFQALVNPGKALEDGTEFDSSESDDE